MHRLSPVLLLFLCEALTAADLIVPATVVRVIDGDSIAVQLDAGPQQVRLHGIDSPELKQPFGREATAALSRILKRGQDIELQPVEHDRYDRMVAVAYAGEVNINEALIADGFAWAYRAYLGQVAGDEGYCELETRARASRQGLWSQPHELWVAPWIFRQRARSVPGARVPSPDYAAQSAADCIADTHRSRPAKQVPAISSAPPAKVGCPIKGNINRKGVKIYHAPGDPDYEATAINEERGERWFCTEKEASAAGWRAAR